MRRPVRGSELRGISGMRWLGRSPFSALTRSSRAKAPLDRVKALKGLRPSHLMPEIPRSSEPRTGLLMGEHQAITTAEWQIGRTAQDELAAASHHNLAAAYDRGFFDDLVTPYLLSLI